MTYKKKHIKYKIVIIVQYIIAENVPSFQSHENYDKIDINHSPSQF